MSRGPSKKIKPIENKPILINDIAGKPHSILLATKQVSSFLGQMTISLYCSVDLISRNLRYYVTKNGNIIEVGNSVHPALAFYNNDFNF